MDEISEHAASIEGGSAVMGSSNEDLRPPEQIDPAHAAIVERGMDQASNGRFASGDDVEAVFRRAGL